MTPVIKHESHRNLLKAEHSARGAQQIRWHNMQARLFARTRRANPDRLTPTWLPPTLLCPLTGRLNS